VQNDVDDIEAVRTHFGLGQLDLVGHSYMGVVVVLYAMAHPERARRVVQIGPSPPDLDRTYPPELAWSDATTAKVMAGIGALQRAPAADPVERCRALWAVLGELYVVDAANAHRIRWGRCELANERAGMRYWLTYLMPSLQRLRLADADLARATAPTLVVHGTHDRSAPYGSGRDWARRLPNARLLTVPGAGHAPWIEAPGVVVPALRTFLGGTWPDAAEVGRA
jgi:pimeloyl-ACP methyl ester carboxylesterase